MCWIDDLLDLWFPLPQDKVVDVPTPDNDCLGVVDIPLDIPEFYLTHPYQGAGRRGGARGRAGTQAMTFRADYPGAIVVEAKNYGYIVNNNPNAATVATETLNSVPSIP